MVITRFQGAANREKRRYWKTAGEQGRVRQTRTPSLFLFSFSLSLSLRLCFRTGSRRFRAITIARLPRLIHLPSHNPPFPSRSLEDVPVLLINENPSTMAPLLFFPFPHIRERDDGV